MQDRGASPPRPSRHPARRTAGRRAGLVLLVAAILASPAILFGSPFLFFDSGHYFLVGQAIVEHLGPSPATVATPPGTDVGGMGAEGTGAEGDGPPAGGGLAAVAGGRSPVYAVLVRLAAQGSGLWALVAAQSLLAAWLILSFLETAWRGLPPAAVAGTAIVLAAASPLGFHAGFVMPDLFAGILVLAASLLGFFRPVGRTRLALAAIVVLAATTHATVAALLVVWTAMLAVARLSPAGRRLVRVQAIVICGAAVLLAFGLDALYAAATRQATGDRIGSPPYLTARVIADGPGALFLAETCGPGGSPFAACVFADRSFADHNDVLWGSGGAALSFATAPPAVREALQREDTAFARAVLARHPVRQTLAAAGNAAAQFFRLGIDELAAMHRLVRNDAFRATGLLPRVPGLAACALDKAACPPASRPEWVWMGAVRIVTTAAVIAHLGLLAALVWRRTAGAAGARVPDDRLLAAGLGIGVMLLANAAICGALSGPDDRYQARLAWLSLVWIAAVAPGLRRWTAPPAPRPRVSPGAGRP